MEKAKIFRHFLPLDPAFQSFAGPAAGISTVFIFMRIEKEW